LVRILLDTQSRELSVVGIVLTYHNLFSYP
jgi:hypothetical protein